MAENLAPPPHLAKARTALSVMGIPTEAGEAALALAAHFFHHTTHLGADVFRRELNQTQHELESVSEQLVKARRQVDMLTQENARLRDCAFPAAPTPQTHQLRKQLRRLQRQVPALQQTVLGGDAPRACVGQVLGVLLLRLLEGMEPSSMALFRSFGADDPVLGPALRQLGQVGATIHRLLRALPDEPVETAAE